MNNQPNFLELSQKATGPDATIEDKNALFKAFFDLQEWVFITPQGEMNPFVSAIDNNKWIFAFTDSNKALEFAKANNDRVKGGFLDEKGGINFITINIKSALNYLYELNKKEGLYGMHINFGLPGWFVPITTLPKIITHLKLTV